MRGVLSSPAVAVASPLRVQRRGIRFRSVSANRVRIEVRVENRGGVRSRPTPLLLESAPFGAFLPWAPLARLTVPSIAAGGATVVTTEALRPRLPAAGGASGRIPRRPRTARGAGDAEPRGPLARRAAGLGDLVERWSRSPGRAGVLAPDVLELLRRGALHWAGNVNVLIGRHAVERHLARALRIHPGRTNLAAFLLGGARASSFVLDVRGDGARWEHALAELGERALERADGAFRLKAEPRIQIVLFACRPPERCTRGRIEVHVQREPAGDTAVVEFELDPRAAGPGCFTV